MITLLDRIGRGVPRAAVLALLVLALVVSVLAGLRAWMLVETPRDFSYFWMTGRIWMNGDNPYSPDYAALAAGVWRDEGFHRWFYTPHIWPITRVLAAFDYDTGRTIWVITNTALIVAGTVLVAMVAPVTRAGRPVLFAGLSIYTALALGAALTLSTGQFAAFVYLGTAAFAFAVVKGARWAMVLALFILTMKASLGLAFVVFALMDRRWWGPTILAGVLAVLASIPVLLATPLGEIISGYLHGIGAYGSYEANRPAAMTGLRTLLDRWMGIDISGLILALTASAGAAGLGLWAARAELARRLDILVAFLALLFFLVPLHLYDMVLISVLAIGLGRPLFAAVLAVACLLLFRVNRVSGLIGIEEPGASGFDGSYLASLILAALLVAAVGALVQRPASAQA